MTSSATPAGLDSLPPEGQARRVLDPLEGVAADGTIRTGAARARVPAAYEPVVEALVNAFEQARAAAPGGTAALLLYGSVATGRARPPDSDVDAFILGLPGHLLDGTGGRLSERFVGLCREVALGAARLEDQEGGDDERYGNRVFLKHYCAVLAGDDVAAAWQPFPADARAARGFNGDIALHLARWRDRVHPALAPAGVAALGRTVARKALLAAAGLVSVHDGTWTTDRATGARRWSLVDPAVADALHVLQLWADGQRSATPADLGDVLAPGGAVERLSRAFAEHIGLWPTDPRSESPTPGRRRG